MLSSIVLFLALFNLGFCIIRYRIAIFEAKKVLSFKEVITLIFITSFLFSIFYYLTHWIMENPQEFLDKNLEELKALQIDEVKVIDGVELKGSLCGCEGCVFEGWSCYSMLYDCLCKSWEFGIEEVK